MLEVYEAFTRIVSEVSSNLSDRFRVGLSNFRSSLAGYRQRISKRLGANARFVEGLAVAGGLILTLSAFPVLIPVLGGLALSALSFRDYAWQREILKGDNPNTAIGVGYANILMCGTFFVTMMLISPLLGPFAPIIPTLFAVSIGVCVVSALCAGGYDKLREDWLKSNLKPLQAIIKTIEFGLKFIPTPIKSFLVRFYTNVHKWLGAVLFAANIAAFVAVTATVSLPLGIAALGYTSLNIMRAQNLLPPVIAKTMEKIGEYMTMLAGFFVNNFLMYVYSAYKIASAVVVDIAAPFLKRHLFGTGLASTDNNPSKQTNKLPQLSKNISLNDFKAQINKVPELKKQEVHDQGIEGDFKNLKRELDSFYDNHREVKLREKAYNDYQSLRTKPGIRNKIKYILGFIPMNLSYALSSVWHYPVTRSQFIANKAKEDTYAVDIQHVASKTPVRIPPLNDFDFASFKLSVETKLLPNEGAINLLTAAAKGSRKFVSPLTEEDRNRKGDLEFENQTLIGAKKILPDNLEPKACVSAFKSLLEKKQNYEKTKEARFLFNPYEKKLLATDSIQGFVNNPKDIADVDLLVAKASSLCEGAIAEINESIKTNDEELGTIRDKEHTALVEFAKQQIFEGCDKVENGNFAIDKPNKSVAVWQVMSKHILAKIQKSIEDNDLDGAAAMLASTFIEAGNFCAEAYYNATQTMFDMKVLGEIVEQSGATDAELLNLNMQWYRKRAFNMLYTALTASETFKAIFFHMDFIDRHDYGYIIRALSELNLELDYGLRRDLSSSNNDFLKEVSASAISFVIAKLLMICDNAYSPAAIVRNMMAQLANPDEADVPEDYRTPKQFGALSCIQKWVEHFEDEEIRNHIKDIVDIKSKNYDEATARQIIIRMLLDKGILQFSRDEELEAFCNSVKNVEQELDNRPGSGVELTNASIEIAGINSQIRSPSSSDNADNPEGLDKTQNYEINNTDADKSLGEQILSREPSEELETTNQNLSGTSSDKSSGDPIFPGFDNYLQDGLVKAMPDFDPKADETRLFLNPKF